MCVNFFSKFGNVVNIQLAHDNNPNTVKVKFANRKEADSVFNSSDAFLNNRWIKMLRQPLQIKANSASPSVDSDQTDDTYCSLCKRTFKSKYHRDWHIKRMHNEFGFNCPICDATFVSANLCNEHCVVQHPIIIAEKKVSKHEDSSPKIDHVTIQAYDLLRIKIKALKEKSKETEKSYSKELKKMKKQLKGLSNKCLHFHGGKR